MYKYKITELNNGLKIITVPNKDKRTCLFKIIVKTGAEHEKHDQQGISHFIEHAFFKGTKEKTKQEIYTEVESYGGKINGRTDNLITQYFIWAPSRYQNNIIDLLSDIFLNFNYTKETIEKEKGVVLAEILRKKEKVDFNNSILLRKSFFGESNPGGWPTLGDQKSIKNMNREIISKYIKDNYIASNIVILMAGNINEKQVIQRISSKFNHLPLVKSKKKKKVKFINTSQEVIINKNHQKQVKIEIWFPFKDMFSEDKYPAKLISSLNNHRGWEKSLKYQLRELNSLIYSMSIRTNCFLDYGFFCITIPTDKNNIEKCLDITLKQLNYLKNNKIDKKIIQERVTSLINATDFAFDNFYERAKNIAKSIVLKNKYEKLESIMEKFKKINQNDLQKVAKQTFNFDKMKICISGNVDKRETVSKVKEIIRKNS